MKGQDMIYLLAPGLTALDGYSEMPSTSLPVFSGPQEDHRAQDEPNDAFHLQIYSVLQTGRKVTYSWGTVLGYRSQMSAPLRGYPSEREWCGGLTSYWFLPDYLLREPARALCPSPLAWTSKIMLPVKRLI